MARVELIEDLIVKRNNMIFQIAKDLAVMGYKTLTRPQVDLHEDIITLKKEKAVFLFAALHKSLWETSGVLIPLYHHNIPLPYIAMGDNLVKGRFFRSMSKKLGIFLVKRAESLRDMPESAKNLKDHIISYFAYGEDVLIFPEGTRKSIIKDGHYGSFFPAAFDAALEYDRNKEAIAQQYRNLSPHDVYIIPVNVDYSKIREDREMLEQHKGKPPTLSVFDSLKMVKKIRDTFIAFGKPIKVSDHKDMNRKELAAFIRRKCMELVKILPINVAARAIVDSVDGERIDLTKIESNIHLIIQKLSTLRDRFRNFTPEDSPRCIWDKVAQYELHFKEKNISIDQLKFYSLYADFIGHYLI